MRDGVRASCSAREAVENQIHPPLDSIQLHINITMHINDLHAYIQLFRTGYLDMWCSTQVVTFLMRLIASDPRIRDYVRKETLSISIRFLS